MAENGQDEIRDRRPPRRALVFAGGGAKVAYQAGVLQVWLDEARVDGRPVEFHVADGASGGVINLAMWCQGMSGRQIADAWRAHRPLRSATPNLAGFPFPFRPSIFSSRGLRDRALRDFGIDWAKIASGPEGRGPRDGTFSLWNVTRQELVAVPAAQVVPDLVLAAISPPLWFPPVRHGGEVWTDAVFATDANISGALRNGVTELWIVWTVSMQGRWRPGFARGYFQLVETAANSRLRSDLQRIRAHNEAVSRDGQGEFGTERIRVRMICAEVPVDYLLNVSRSAIARAVDLGVRGARRWCREQDGITLELPPEQPAASVPEDLVFGERMSGNLVWGATEPRAGTEGTEEPVTVSLRIVVRDLRRFIQEPDHVAQAGGTIRGDEWIGTSTIERGTFNLLVDAGPDSQRGDKHMVYDLRFRDAAGRRLSLRGRKYIQPNGWLSSWHDTTTLYARLIHLDAEDGRGVIAAGELRISAAGFVRQLASMRAFAPTPVSRAEAVGRFGRFFAGQLWQVYGRRRRRTMPPAYGSGLADGPDGPDGPDGGA